MASSRTPPFQYLWPISLLYTTLSPSIYSMLELYLATRSTLFTLLPFSLFLSLDYLLTTINLRPRYTNRWQRRKSVSHTHTHSLSLSLSLTHFSSFLFIPCQYAIMLQRKRGAFVNSFVRIIKVVFHFFLHGIANKCNAHFYCHLSF